MTVPHDPKLNGRDWYAAFCNASEAHVRVAGELRALKRRMRWFIPAWTIFAVTVAGLLGRYF